MQPVSGGLTFSEAIEAYFHEQRLTSGWTPGTFFKKEAALDIAAELLGPDAPIAGIGKAEASGLKEMLLALPANRSKIPTLARQGITPLSAQHQLLPLTQCSRGYSGPG